MNVVIVITILQEKIEQLKLNNTVTLITLITLTTLIMLIGECKCKFKLVDTATAAREQMRISVIDFFEKLLSPGIQCLDKDKIRILSSLKVSGFPQDMHLENVEFHYQHQSSAKRKRVRLNIESMLNSGYPFIYSVREGGRNEHKQKQETFYA